jgi:hypothetical protein
MHDADHLRRVGSPFAKLVPAVRDEESVRWFHATFAEELATYNPPAGIGSTLGEQGQKLFPLIRGE